MARLIRDEPDWWFMGFEAPSTRRLRVYEVSPDYLVAVITEDGDTDSTSITNAAETVIAQVRAEHPGKEVDVIEHYLASRFEDEHFDAVTLTHRGSPRWTPVPVAGMVGLFGPDIVDGTPPPPPLPDDGITYTLVPDARSQLRQARRQLRTALGREPTDDEVLDAATAWAAAGHDVVRLGGAGGDGMSEEDHLVADLARTPPPVLRPSAPVPQYPPAAADEQLLPPDATDEDVIRAWAQLRVVDDSPRARDIRAREEQVRLRRRPDPGTNPHTGTITAEEYFEGSPEGVPSDPAVLRREAAEMRNTAEFLDGVMVQEPHRTGLADNVLWHHAVADSLEQWASQAQDPAAGPPNTTQTKSSGGGAPHPLLARPIELARQIGALQLPRQEAQVEILRIFQSLPALAGAAGRAAAAAADRLGTSFVPAPAVDALRNSAAKWSGAVASGVALVRRYLAAHKHLLDRVLRPRADERHLNI